MDDEDLTHIDPLEQADLQRKELRERRPSGEHRALCAVYAGMPCSCDRNAGGN
jgi:hypothetical protein